MTPLTTRSRTGATLVELLVVMAIITALGALALMVLPSIANSDNTLRGTADVQSTLRSSQSMAGSSRLPRGVRFLVTPGTTYSTEMQFLEAPPVMVADPQVLVGGRATHPDGSPWVEFIYNPPTATVPTPTPAPGTIYYRQCIIRGLTQEQADQVTAGATLVLPTLNAWSKIIAKLGQGASTTHTLPAGTFFDVSVNLEVFPDALLGVATEYRTYHFGINGAPVPLVGEPNVLLSKNTAVDLALSSPPLQTGQTYYDVVFAPSGQLLVATDPTVGTNSAVFLWVRDITKVVDMSPIASPPTNPLGRTPWTFDPAKFRQGGEQQIVGIRNGFIGTAPVLWPDNAGTYSGTDDPYTLARTRLN